MTGPLLTRAGFVSMEIWFLSEDISLAAQSLTDKDLRKQITAVRNLLARCFMKRVHTNSHVYFKWVMASPWNYYWLSAYGVRLEKEFNLRFLKVHKYYSEFQNLKVVLPPLIGKGTLIEFPNVHPVAYKGQSTAEAHRLHYLKLRRVNSKWTSVAAPQWWQDAVNSIHITRRPHSPSVVREFSPGLSYSDAVKRSQSKREELSD